MAQGVLGVVFIDLILAGDNALLIGLVSQKLHPSVRRTAIFWGSIGAIGLRILFVFFTFQLLQFPILRTIGGILIVLIAMKLVLPLKKEKHIREAQKFWEALWIIISADVIMSLDNVLAVAGIARENFLLFLFGICLSLPFIFWGSQTIARLMDTWPVLILVGGLFLAWVGGAMMADGAFLHHSHFTFVKYGISGLAVAIVFFWWFHKLTASRNNPSTLRRRLPAGRQASEK